MTNIDWKLIYGFIIVIGYAIYIIYQFIKVYRDEKEEKEKRNK